jgi:CAAX protease family protein
MLPRSPASAAPAEGIFHFGPGATANRGDAVIILALTALLIVVPLVPLPVAAAASLGVIALTGLAWARRAPAATSLGVLFAICLALAVAGVGPQQTLLAAAFSMYAVVIVRVQWLRGGATWLRIGTLSGRLAALGAGVAAGSAVALLTWYATFRPDLADLVRTYIPAWPLWMLVPGAIAFSLVNAALEEAAYRGVVLEALDAAIGPGVGAVVLQATAFGALHFEGGFPRGTVGVGLAFVYGLVLGVLRRKTGGLVVPIFTHVLTDLVIVGIVIALVRQ